MTDTGICGNTIAGITGDPLVCDLPAGHDGWHGCDNPPAMGGPTRCHWGLRDNVEDAHHEGFGAGVEWADKDRDKAIAAARSAGFDLAVAALRDGEAWARWCAQAIVAAGAQHIDIRNPTEPADYLAAVRSEVLGTADGGT